MSKTTVVRPLSAGKKMKLKKYGHIWYPQYFRLQLASPQQIGVWTAVATEQVELDRNYYSKAWHRRHGRRVVTSDRKVTFTSEKGVVRIANLDSWKGNWRLKALVEAGLVKSHRGSMHVRLNPAFEIKLIGIRLGHKFYLRSIKGIDYDYCIVSPLGMTYHDQSIPECIAGLKRKQAEVEVAKTASIDWSYLVKLGFCEEGIREFCGLFGFDVKGRATPQEVYDRVKIDHELARPFVKELRILAKATDFEVPEWN